MLRKLMWGQTESAAVGRSLLGGAGARGPRTEDACRAGGAAFGAARRPAGWRAASAYPAHGHAR
eukprot:4311753-Alexandrium_andersonii.AAC.1